MMKKKVALELTILFSVMLTYVGCGNATTPTVIPSPAIPTMQQSWQKDWEQTLAAAKKEGELRIYTTNVGVQVKTALKDALMQKYGIALDVLSGTGPELTSRIYSERRAGLYISDLFLAGPITPVIELKPSGVLAPIKPLLVLPEVLDTSSYFDNEIPFVDKEGVYTIFNGPYVSFHILVNSDMVKPGEITGYGDLLDARWKGKIVMGDPTISGASGKMFSITAGYIMSPDFHRQMVRQEPTITRDIRMQVEWVARGKYSIGFGPTPDPVADFLKAGAPIRIRLAREGVYLAAGPSGTISYFDRAPHPNAAKVFVNWFMTREGLTTWSRSSLQQSARKDVPTDHLVPELVRDPNKKYFNPTREDIIQKEPQFQKLAAEIYAPLLK